MILGLFWWSFTRHGIPRESGDDPNAVKLIAELNKYSPRERG